METFVDLNDLCVASFNELKRIKFIEDKSLEELSDEEKLIISNKLFEKLGDKFIETSMNLDENGNFSAIEFKFSEINTFTELILLFALCYINNMDLNNFFELHPKAKNIKNNNEINKF